MTPRSTYQTLDASHKCRTEVNARFNETKVNIKSMSDEVREIKETQIKQGEEMKYMRVTMNSIDMKLDKFICSSDKRYASKLSEKIVYTIAGLILTGAITAGLTLIFK